MIKVLSILSMLFPTITSNVSIGISPKVSEEIKIDSTVNRSALLWEIKNWETETATFIQHWNPITWSYKKAHFSIDTLNINVPKIYLRTKTEKLGYGWSEGSSRGYQSTNLYCDGWYKNNIEVNKGETRKEEIAMTYFTNADGYKIGNIDLWFTVSFLENNTVDLELEEINKAETYKLFSWAKTGATFNFDFLITWDRE